MSKKILALALAFAFAFSFTAKAVTIEELQAQIQQLLAQLAQLQGQQSSGMYCFNTDLKYGMTSNDVKNLQIVLGVTPQTGYFGPITLAAVKSYQASKGIITTGYVGPLTRAALNAQYCVPPTTTTTVPPTTAPAETTTTTTGVTTEGTLTASAAAIYTESTLKWGTSNQTIYGFKVKAKNSDITIKRIYVSLTGSSFIPWKDLSYIVLYDGDNAVKGVEVTKANLVENSYASDYDVYFDGLNIVVAKDAEKTFSIKVSTLPTPENRTSFTIQLEANGIRGVDGAGLNQYNSSAVASKSVTYESSRTGASVTIKSDYTTPSLGVIAGSSDNVTKDQTIFKFGIKATNNDVTLKTAAITLTQSDEDLLTAVYLFDGDTRLSSVTPTATTSAQTITFSDLNVAIAKDTTKSLTVKVDIAKVDGSTLAEGASISSIATAGTSSFAFIDANDNNVTSVRGSASGYDQTVYIAYPVFALTSAKLTSISDSSDTAYFTFTVKAEGGDVKIKNDGVTIAVTTDSTTTTSAADVLDTTATLSSGYYIVPEGQTISFIASEQAIPKGSLAKVTEITWKSDTVTSDQSASDIYDFANWKAY